MHTATSQVVQAGSAGKHWYTERVAAVGLLALIPAGFMYPNPVVDYGLAVLIPLHGHWSGSVESTIFCGTQISPSLSHLPPSLPPSLQHVTMRKITNMIVGNTKYTSPFPCRGYLAVAEDYMPEVLKGAAKGLVYVLTASVFAGLMYLNMKDIGICAAVKAVWSL